MIEMNKMMKQRIKSISYLRELNKTVLSSSTYYCHYHLCYYENIRGYVYTTE